MAKKKVSDGGKVGGAKKLSPKKVAGKGSSKGKKVGDKIKTPATKGKNFDRKVALARASGVPKSALKSAAMSNSLRFRKVEKKGKVSLKSSQGGGKG